MEFNYSLDDYVANFLANSNSSFGNIIINFGKSTYYVDTVLTVVFTLVGTVGNGLTIMAVSNKHTKKSAFTVFLAALAVVDTLVLYSTLSEKLINNFFKEMGLVSGRIICKLEHFFRYLFPQISSWIIVSLTVERYLCAYFPLHARTFNRCRSGYIVVTVISLLAITLNCHFMFTMDAYSDGIETFCLVLNFDFIRFVSEVWPWIDFFVYCIIPILLIISANTATIVQVYRSRRSVKSSQTASAARHLLLITLLVSSSFILLTFPLSCHNVLKFVNMDITFMFDIRFQTAFVVMYNFKTFNHAVNFFLYVVSGSRFRADLKAAFTCCGQRQIQVRPRNKAGASNKSEVPKEHTEHVNSETENESKVQGIAMIAGTM